MSERPPLPHPPEQVRAELQRRCVELLAALGVRDQAKAGMVTPLNPTRDDRRPGSFVIWTQGEAAGAWSEYATGEKGDVFDLIQYLGGLARWIDAYWWALQFLGWGRGEVRRAAVDQAELARRERDRKAAEARQARIADNKAKKALGFWLECQADLRGTPAWTYLTEVRGLPMATLGRMPGALRFHPAAEHVSTETGEVTEWPALVSAMSHWDGGAVRAIHRTYLAPDGRGKAPVDVAKKMLGVAQGAAIRVWKGAAPPLSPEEAARKGVSGPLIVTEGIEDALTAAIARPDDRVWAAGSLSLMGRLGWPPCASAVVLVADNDWKPEAVAAFGRVETHWRGLAAGRPLKVARAQAGKDLNDWARGEA